jgi:hypothetical protein
MREDRMEVVLDEIGITGGDQRQDLRARVCHVGCRVEPVFKKEEEAEHEAGDLVLAEEVRSQQQGHQPLQQGSAPESQRWTKPPEEIVAAFVNDQIGAVDEQEPASSGGCIGQKTAIEQEPRNERGTRDRLPRLVENRLQVFEHSSSLDSTRHLEAWDITNVRGLDAPTARPGRRRLLTN